MVDNLDDDHEAIHIGVYGAATVSDAVTRTNIDIDDDLIEEAMELYGTTTKKETVELALRRLVGRPMTTAEVLAMEGTGWEGDLDEMRDDDVEIWP